VSKAKQRKKASRKQLRKRQPSATVHLRPLAVPVRGGFVWLIYYLLLGAAFVAAMTKGNHVET
jgi:hypothetical protein